MRNHSSKYHLPSKEVTRIVRFNGKDYLMSSLYDDALNFDFDKEYEKSLKDEKDNRLPWFDKIVHNSRRVNESFYDDMDDFFSEEEIENSIAMDVSDDDDNYYVVYNENGDRIEITLSEDRTKNAVFFLFINFMVISQSTTQENLKSVDQILYTTGSMNNVKSYKMDISGIEYKNGSFKLKYSSRNINGYIQAYFVSNEDVQFSISLPGINMRKTGQLVTFSYADFCDFMRYDKWTINDKNPMDYYNVLLKKLISLYQKYNINMTVCTNKHTGMNMCEFKDITSKMLKCNLDVLYKFKNGAYDFNKLWQRVVDD